MMNRHAISQSHINAGDHRNVVTEPCLQKSFDDLDALESSSVISTHSLFTTVKQVSTWEKHSSNKSMVVFSGGSALNPFVHMLQSITNDIAYVLPVSDDGGSTAEIVRIVGGPGIGDIRSRIIRLAETKSMEAQRVHELLTYRLPANDSPTVAKAEWLAIVEGSHPLWSGISEPYKETIRSFLCHFNTELLRQSVSKGTFDFRSGSIGNFFITGSRLFFNSLEAAIFQFARITRNPETTEVIPANVTSGAVPVTIAALLRNETIIHGQCEISHPGSTESQGARNLGLRRQSQSTVSENSTPTAGFATKPLKSPNLSPLLEGTLNTRFHETKSQDTKQSNNILYSKTTNPPLPAPIRRIYYVNSELQELQMKLNPLLVPHLSGSKKTILYAIGSLYTSIIPCLVIPGIAHLIYDPVYPTVEMHANRHDGPMTEERLTSLRESKLPAESAKISPTNILPPRVKILLLNGTSDRESFGYSAIDFILAITDALNYSWISKERSEHIALSAINIHTLFGNEQIDKSKTWESDTERKYVVYPNPPRAYITHLLYTEDSLVKVDVSRIESTFGIMCVKVKSGQSKDRNAAEQWEPGYYDVDELKKVLEPVVM